jgi:hypothetical protein
MRKLLPIGIGLVCVLLLSGWMTWEAHAAPTERASLPERDTPAEWAAPEPRPAASASAIELRATTEITDYLVTEGHDFWAVGGGQVYWSRGCYQVDFPYNAWLKRKSLNGGATTTLDSIYDPANVACKTFATVHADDDGVYYISHVDTGSPKLMSWLIGAADPITVANLEADFTGFTITSDADRLYYTQSGGIYRASKDSFGGARISDATSVNGLVVDDTYIYFITTTALQRSLKTCTSSSCWDNKTAFFSFVNSAHLRRIGDYLYYFYYEQTDGVWYWKLGRTPLGPGFQHMQTLPTGLVALGPPAASGGYIFWLEAPASDYVRLQRMLISGGPAQTVAELEPIGILPNVLDMEQMYSDASGVIIREDDGIFRLPYGLQPIQRDLKVDEWLVVQTLQNRAHSQSGDDAVPFVANKSTYALLYAQLVTGTRTNNAEAALHINDAHGYEYHLAPDNGVLPFLPGESSVFTRTDKQVWFFRIPEWMLDPGSVTLEAEIDPRGLYDDPNPANNARSQTFTFNKRNPVCAIFIPVRTHDPLPSTEDPFFWDMVNRYKQQWPVPDVWVYHQRSPAEELEICWLWGFIPYPCNGPYEINESASIGDWVEDANEVILDIQARESFSDDPDECDGDGWAVQYVGMVNGEANTGSINGVGSLYFDAAWVRLPSHQAPANRTWTWPGPGFTLAHETTHNYGRGHTDCGGPDGVGYYPYQNTCQLDDYLTDGNPANDDLAHFGFDWETRALIAPTAARDYMAYGDVRWVSDYTWRMMYHKIAEIEELTLVRADGTAAPTAADEVAAASSVVMLNGLVDMASDQAQLNHAWVYPSSALSRGLMRKWQALAAPRASYLQAGLDGAAALRATDFLTYHVQLLDAGGAVLDDRLVALSLAAFDLSAPYTGTQRIATFGLTFPAPTGTVASLRLMTATTVLDTVTPGQNPPTITLFSPAGGQVYNSSMKIQWHAEDTDNDALLYSIQYSPDGGAHWNALVTSFPWPSSVYTAELALDTLDDLHGTVGVASSLIRVAASDGYHTAIASSQPFTIPNHPPQPVIVAPQQNEVFDAGQKITVKGEAYDVEDGGNIPATAYSWELDSAGAGTSMAELNFYGLAPGDHDIALTVEDSEGADDTAERTITVLPLYVPLRASAPMTMDGQCDDTQYAYGRRVQLSPYAGGYQTTIRMLRTSTDLWVCFSGLQSGQGMSPTPTVSIAGLLVDGNYSRGSLPQANQDYAFLISEDGAPSSKAWDGVDGFHNPGPSGYAAVTSGNAGVWSAEMRIDSAALGGWDHLAGFAFIHYSLYPDNLNYMHAWPQYTDFGRPNTWGKTALGKQPVIETLTPATQDVTGNGLIFGLTGQNFDDATVLWNGQPLTTVDFGSSYLMATIPAGYMSTAGQAAITVRNGDAASPFVSNILYFTVTNPDPQASSLSPTAVDAGSPAFTLVVTGTDFVSGAKVLWNGEEKTTTVISATRLMTQIGAEEVAHARAIGVAVLNPTPGGGVSDVLTFVVEIPGRIYLPLVLRSQP